jgi:hypothetical protein
MRSGRTGVLWTVRRERKSSLCIFAQLTSLSGCMALGERIRNNCVPLTTQITEVSRCRSVCGRVVVAQKPYRHYGGFPSIPAIAIYVSDTFLPTAHNGLLPLGWFWPLRLPLLTPVLGSIHAHLSAATKGVWNTKGSSGGVGLHVMVRHTRPETSSTTISDGRIYTVGHTGHAKMSTSQWKSTGWARGPFRCHVPSTSTRF